MESLISLVIGLMFLIGLSVPFAFLYRYRRLIRKWIKGNPRCYELWQQTAVKRADRAVVKAGWDLEDAQDYAAYVRAEEYKTQSEELEAGS